MALRTIKVKIIGDVVRISHIVVILLMTGVAVGRRSGISVRMTGDALQRQMCPC